jgi:hypothetical protein
VDNTLILELKHLPNWVVTYPSDKRPLNPRNGHLASVTDKTTWSDYETANARVQSKPDLMLGFVLTTECSISCIDLDSHKTNDPDLKDEHDKICEWFKYTYSEFSPNNGIHIWCKGSLDRNYKWTDKLIAIYSDRRYMTVTERVINNYSFTDGMDKLTPLADYLGRSKATVPTEFESMGESYSDAEVFARAHRALNSDTFNGLWYGPWDNNSDNDLGLFNCLWFHSRNAEQAKRMWYSSPLFAANDAVRKKRKYLPDYTAKLLFKATDLEFPVMNLIFTSAPLLVDVQSLPVEIGEPVVASDWRRPPGLLGDIADFIYHAAPYPNMEVALAGAIGFLAGLTGRAYNTPTHTGLNHYIAIVGKTGIGKEGAQSGISKLCKPLLKDEDLKDLIHFMGPAEIASAQALTRRLPTSPAMWSYKGEIGIYLQRLTSKNAQPNERNLKALLLDLFHKSGANDMFNGSIYADGQKDVVAVNSPAFTFIGDSTPSEFYKAVDGDEMIGGLMGRFTVVECPDVRPFYNDAPTNAPSKGLLDRLKSLARRVIRHNQRDDSVPTVVGETPDAKAFQLAYQKSCQDKEWENSHSNPNNIIWSRAHIRLLRLGALIAVGNNPDGPTVTIEDYQWAETLIDRSIQAVVKRFESGDVGTVSAAFKQRQAVGTLVQNRDFVNPRG